MFNEWSTFAELLSFRLEIMQRFDAQNGVSQRGCDNPKCCKIGAKTEFKRCSGCKAFRYCSRECQTADWHEGAHRSACPLHRDQYRFVDERFTSRDRAFLRFLLHHDYLQARRKILFDQVPILRDNPDCPAWTMFDYRHGGVEIGTHLIDLEGENAPEWLDRVARTVESGGRMQLHVMLLRDGELTKFWVMPLRSNSSFVRDSVVRLGASVVDGTDGLVGAFESLEIPEDVVEIH
ncbi:hypothetical protein DFH08DRAFT_945482 [Mycena albidolilacea]|uniref:MYND-type domain-containing protein n=1 Tax=Mycena albidolilacea TaxID=1033008 RepID=A0AAD7E8N3_9AGAR|nr:hypothetical protein DFH08DRAFT_945482 [Mycena albidolilacea]